MRESLEHVVMECSGYEKEMISLRQGWPGHVVEYIPILPTGLSFFFKNLGFLCKCVFLAKIIIGNYLIKKVFSYIF